MSNYEVKIQRLEWSNSHLRIVSLIRLHRHSKVTEIVYFASFIGIERALSVFR